MTDFLLIVMSSFWPKYSVTLDKILSPQHVAWNSAGFNLCLLTYLVAYLLACSLACLCVCLFAYSLTCLLARLPACPLARLLASSLARSLTCLLPCLHSWRGTTHNALAVSVVQFFCHFVSMFFTHFNCSHVTGHTEYSCYLSEN